MPDVLVSDIVPALGTALLGGILFAAIGLIAGTSESATIAPATLLIVLLGFPPAACYTFCISAIVSKHIIHAAPTALLGIPGDTMAVPMLEPCAVLRRLGVPHVALQKMISAGVIASIVTIPIAVAFASVLAPLGDTVKAWAGAIFTVVALAIAYTSKGRWASVCMVVPFALVIQALDRTALAATGNRLVICFSLGIAIGPMFGDLLTALSPVSRDSLRKSGPTVLWLAPEIRNWSSIFPNPLAILTRRQKVYTLVAASASALTFTFSPVGMTIMVGEIIQSRLKSLYEKHTTAVAVMNGTTEATYLAEVIIPLVAFGIPLSPTAMVIAFPLFNAPPVFTTQPLHNLHTMMTSLGFFGYGLMSVLVACAISYPLAMNYSHRAAAWTMKHISQEAILTMFSALIVVLSYYEGRWVGVTIAVTIGSIGGLMNKFLGVNIGTQFMTFYASSWIVQQLFGIA